MAWILLTAPLISAVVIFIGFRSYHRVAERISIGSCAISFLTSLAIIFGWIGEPAPILWMNFEGLRLEFGLLIDPLSKLMIFISSGVGLLIHVFSVGYMKEDPARGRFFGLLSLFVFSMLGIVVATNFFQMFFFWELVGLCSYLLIGFWFKKPSASDAAKKAFITNRVGDFGFLLGILAFWGVAGTIFFGADPKVLTLLEGSPWITWIGVLLFCGCIGKSAQVPLHVWLPDAMEGPTPVSALIHAATMVAAGVYMLARIFFVLELSPFALSLIAYVGGATALLGGLIATQQNDIKRILAYSTLSHLGYMVMAVGLGGWGAAMFHLTTHAFFKALLFLGAGAIIYALHHEQNIWKMGGLRQRMPISFWSILIGAMALAGVPFFSGFFSKEEILFLAFHHSLPLFIVGAFTAALTAFYMTRFILIIFFGKPKSEQAQKAKEVSWVMWIPLVTLAILSFWGGMLINIPEALGQHLELVGYHNTVLFISILMLFLGSGIAYFLYRGKKVEPLGIGLLENNFYIDTIYERTLLLLQTLSSRFLSWVDQCIIDFWIVRGTAFIVTMGGEALRLIQNGNIRVYTFLLSLGGLGILFWILS